MLHTVMRPSIDSAADRRAAVLDDVADAAADAELPIAPRTSPSR
jgi:hypothetical protein